MAIDLLNQLDDQDTAYRVTLLLETMGFELDKLRKDLLTSYGESEVLLIEIADLKKAIAC